MKLTICLCITILMVFGGQLVSLAAVSDDGLILYLGFDRVENGKISDGTGGGNDGTLADGAEITTQENVYGAGSLEIVDQNASAQVASFPELAEYQDNSYVFWINFIQGSNGAWSQIIAKPAPGADRSPGIWVRPAELGIHYRFNPGNKGAGYVGPGGNNTQFETKNGTTSLALGKVQSYPFMLMENYRLNTTIFQLILIKARIHSISEKVRDIELLLSILMIFISSTELSV